MSAPLKISYPAELPISQRADEIAAAITDHQVVIVAGETGSGKTTQLPKICLQLGRGETGMIGHTQPRRLAARTVADRIATELDTPLGDLVGYQVRFNDHVGPTTRVKLMTDGILLAELANDRQLRRYDTLIVDEAHERSLNIDFLLGYLTRLLPQRPDLKLIITSATIDPHRFSRHFRQAPVIEVSGRTYPVENRYRPNDDPDTDQIQAIGNAVTELANEGPGDILVFLSGEREIRDTAEALRHQVTRERRLTGTEILPLYARLSLAEQHRVFQPTGNRRIVLATNVAETSLTVPGIRYVIDPGTARISRYSQRLKVQRLPIEPISQASAQQRAGRCGRLADGICIRLYSQEDFDSRPEFTEPEILRTNLASVILQMAALRLGDIAEFPFVDPPDRRQITDGIRLLDELGALERDPAPDPRRLTPLGRQLARLPVDPRLGRMVIEADRNGCLPEVTVIAAALSIQDPRERPTDKREAADTHHARFTDPGSDFLAYLNLWHYLQEQQKELSSSRFRRMCRNEHLNYLRVREWQDVHQQLQRAARDLHRGKRPRRTTGDQPPTPPQQQPAADPDRIHASLLAGLLSHLGMKELPTRQPTKTTNARTPKDRRRNHEYLGARGARFAIAPGSALFKKPPDWVMVAELVETSRLWGRTAATIAPEWVEPIAGHLVKRTYSEPHWNARRGAVLAHEKVTLYGLPIVPRRTISYAKIDPETARALFIRHALVEGDWQTHHAFYEHNQQLLARVDELEHRARRRDIRADDQRIYDFYDQRIPDTVVSGAHFDKWWKHTRRDQPELLHLSLAQLIDPDAGTIDETDYPDHWTYGQLRFPLTYQFEPGQAADGVTATIALPALDTATAAGFDWQVPGLRHELVTALIRSLPKPVRRQLVPVPQVAADALATLTPYRQPLTEALGEALRALTGVTVPPDAWDLSRVPDHLKITYRVVGEPDAAGAHTVLGEGKDLAQLRARLRPAARASLAAAASTVEKRGLRDWTFGQLPRQVELTQAGHTVTAYPTLVDTGQAVDVRVVPTAQEQAHHLPAGLRRLLLLTLPSPAGYVSGRLADEAKLALLHNPHGGIRQLLADCAGCAIDALVAETDQPQVWDEAAFTALREKVAPQLNRATLGVVTEVLPVVRLAHQLDEALSATRGAQLAASVADLREQLSGLIHAGFITEIGWQRLPDLHRWLRAMQRRLEKLPGNPDRDDRAMEQVERVQAEYARLRAALPEHQAAQLGLDRVRWMIEELRVSLFAQQLGTPYPISEQRILRALAQF